MRDIQNVLQRVVDLAQALQDDFVAPAREDWAGSIPEIVQVVPETLAESAHTVHHRVTVVRFDDEVEVIRLDGELDDAEVGLLRLAQGIDDHAARAVPSERAKTREALHGDVCRVVTSEPGTGRVRRAALTLLAPSALARAAPSARKS